MDAEFVKKLKKIMSSHAYPNVFFQNHDLKLEDILTELKKENSKSTLYPLIRLHDTRLPLDLLVSLHENDILLATTYIYHKEEAAADDITTALYYIIVTRDCKCNAKTTLDKMLSFLITIGDHSPPKIRNIVVTMLDSLTLRVVKYVLESEENSYLYNYFNGVFRAKGVVPHLLRQFITKHLTAIFRSKINSVSLEEAFNAQMKEYTSNCAPQMLKNFYLMIFEYLGSGALDQIVDTIIEGDFNWKYVLLALSTYCSKYPDCMNNLKDFIEEIFDEAFENKDADLLGTAMLLQRQCCAEELRTYVSYPEWFGTFSPKTPENCVFWFSFLSRIAPYEPAIFLKIHINKVPSVPVQCRPVLTDYIALCKTRLADMNETFDYVGLFKETRIAQQNNEESDVARVLRHFQNTGEIIKTITQAALFRKQYYQEVFLKELTNTDFMDDQLRCDFILKLHANGKIPNSIFMKWKHHYDSKRMSVI